MGCFFAKEQNNEAVNDDLVSKKTYSWDEKRKLVSDAKNFIIEDLENHEEIRIPGSVNGEQFIIQNCKDCTIYILDHINTITIDDCINCKIILGPVEGSAFIRNCKSCTCVLACGQFRMRDSNKINVFLFCATQPIIEASTRVYFGSYQLHYSGIEDHFHKANLNSAKPNWKDIYDFTPVEYEENWNFIKTDKITEYISEPKLEDTKNKLVKCEHSWSHLDKSAGDKCFDEF